MSERKNRKNKIELTSEDIEKISVKQTFKSINALCTYMGLEASSGNTQKAAVKTLNQYLKFEKTGNKREIIITEIFESKHQRNDMRHKKPFEYDREFQIILDDFFKKQRSELRESSIFTSNQLFFHLNGYSNVFYENFTINTEKVAHENLGVSAYSFDLFKGFLKSICKEKILPRLNRYAESGKILFAPVIVIDKEIYREGDAYYELIKEVQDSVIKELGFETYGKAIFGKANREQFFEAVNKKLKEHEIESFYNAFELTNKNFTVDYTDEELKNAINTWNVFICQKTLDRLYSYIQTINKKNIAAEEEFYSACLDDTVLEKPTSISYHFDFHDSTKADVERLINKNVFSGEKLVPEEIVSIYIPKNEEYSTDSEYDFSFIDNSFSN